MAIDNLQGVSVFIVDMLDKNVIFILTEKTKFFVVDTNHNTDRENIIWVDSDGQCDDEVYGLMMVGLCFDKRVLWSEGIE